MEKRTVKYQTRIEADRVRKFGETVHCSGYCKYTISKTNLSLELLERIDPDLTKHGAFHSRIYDLSLDTFRRKSRIISEFEKYVDDTKVIVILTPLRTNYFIEIDPDRGLKYYNNQKYSFEVHYELWKLPTSWERLQKHREDYRYVDIDTGVHTSQQ